MKEKILFLIINFIHRKVEKEKCEYIYNIHKYSISNNMKKTKKNEAENS